MRFALTLFFAGQLMPLDRALPGEALWTTRQHKDYHNVTTHLGRSGSSHVRLHLRSGWLYERRDLSQTDTFGFDKPH
jgi:hypothetical protein